MNFSHISVDKIRLLGYSIDNKKRTDEKNKRREKDPHKRKAVTRKPLEEI